MKEIRNFSIIAHIDHGKSTLADRMLEITGTVEKRKMKDQMLDQMELERERGITIKMTPVTMNYRCHLDRRQTQTDTQTNADSADLESDNFLYKDLTYKIRGAAFNVKKELGLGHKESVYHNALKKEFEKNKIPFESEKSLSIKYNGENVGTYQPDFIIDGKIILELKALPNLARPQYEQLWSYVKGSEYKLGMLTNFGSTDVEFKRVVYDSARSTEGLRKYASSQRESAEVEYILNLIDTPGHIDFSYEVSRALKAVEGAILLVDATQGAQAQTLTTLAMAREFGLTIIPVLNKIDSPLARIDEIKNEVVDTLKCSPEEVLEVSGKTGEGVEKLLEEVVKRIPPPKITLQSDKDFRGLVFDFQYSDHKGIIVFVRVFDGMVSKGDSLVFSAAKEKFTSLEIGIFSPEAVPKDSLQAGEIGYIVTGIKKPGIASVGDTLRFPMSNVNVLPGYMKPSPVVWASVYPESQDDFADLSRALDKLQLTDSSFSYEEEASGLLGRGFRIGFLGTLHMEIFVERLHREFDVRVVVTTPSIMYEIKSKNGKTQKIYSPSLFPDFGNIESITEPWVDIEIITPNDYMSPIMQLLFEHEAEVGNSDVFGDGRINMHSKLPLRELMRGFFDKLKSVSAGYASISYKIGDMRSADVARLDLLVAEEIVPAFTKVVSKKRIEEEAKASVEKLYKALPRQMFVAKIQAMALGRIISSKTLSALKKDVTGHLYGGDITRKMKLREKQKKGKKKMKERGKVNIPQDVFLKMMR